MDEDEDGYTAGHARSLPPSIPRDHRARRPGPRAGASRAGRRRGRHRGRDRAPPRRRRPQAPGVDPPALHRRREPRHGGGLRVHDAAGQGRRLPAGRPRADRRSSVGVRDPGRRRAPHRRPVLHVRREAGRSRGVVVAALRGRDPGPARAGQGRHGARRRQPEGPGDGDAGRALRHPRRGEEGPREPRAGGRGRRGDRLAAFPAGRSCAPRSAPRSRARWACSCPARRRIPTAARSSPSARRAWSSWSWWPRAGSGAAARARTCTPACARCWTAPPSTSCRRWPRWSPPPGIPPSRGSPTPRGPRRAAERAMLDTAASRIQEEHLQEGVLGGALGPRPALARGAGAAVLRAHGEHRGPGRRLHRPRRQDRAARARGGQARPAPRARHDLRRRGGRAEGPPRRARLRRHRGQPQRRLRSHQHRRRRADHPRRARGLPPRGARPHAWSRATRGRTRATSSPASR